MTNPDPGPNPMPEYEAPPEPPKMHKEKGNKIKKNETARCDGCANVSTGARIHRADNKCPRCGGENFTAIPRNPSLPPPIAIRTTF